MFTGIIETTGRIERIQPISEGVSLMISCCLQAYQPGESIAVNGICLTVVSFGDGWFRADASSETLSRTNLGGLRVGGAVNLERALRLGDRLGGHWVSGHVDGTGTIAAVTQHGVSKAVKVEADSGILRYVVEKGSVTLDGASLTVNDVSERSFEVMLIPHTQQVLFEGFASAGRRVNIEVDILGKYVEKLLTCKDVAGNDISGVKPSLSLDRLRENGFF